MPNNLDPNVCKDYQSKLQYFSYFSVKILLIEVFPRLQKLMSSALICIEGSHLISVHIVCNIGYLSTGERAKDYKVKPV